MSHPVLFCNLGFSCMPLSFTFTCCRFSCQFFCTTCFQPVIHSPKYIYSPISLCQLPDCLCTPSRQAFQGFPYDLFTRWYLLCLSEIFFPPLVFWLHVIHYSLYDFRLFVGIQLFVYLQSRTLSNRLLSFYILSLAGKLKQIWHRIKMKISQCHSNAIFMFCVTCTGKTLMLVVNKHPTIIFLSCHVMQKKKKEILLVNTFSPFSFVPTQLNLSFL